MKTEHFLTFHSNYTLIRKISGDEPVFKDLDAALNYSVLELNSLCLR